MVQLETWKAFVDVGVKLWSGVGPLVGVLVGTLLARSWDRKKWMNDNRKEECRELLTAMTKVADSCLEARAQTESAGAAKTEAVQAAWAEDRKCMIILQDRIFIAQRLSQEKMFKRWNETTSEFLKEGDVQKFGERLNTLKQIVIDIASKG
jgi:hypothetical protein